MKKKNKLKHLVDYCFICGKHLTALEDKQGHRINPKKGNAKNNVVILCSTCKKRMHKEPIESIMLSKQVLEKYFKNLPIEHRKLILGKIVKKRIEKLTGRKGLIKGLC